MKKNLKYFENELSRLNKEFADYKKKYIGTPEIGKVIELAGMDWLILDKTEKGYFAILNGFDEKERTFDSTSNNWITSKLRNELNARFLKKITDELGKDAVIEFDRDLLRVQKRRFSSKGGVRAFWEPGFSKPVKKSIKDVKSVTLASSDLPRRETTRGTIAYRKNRKLGKPSTHD